MDKRKRGKLEKKKSGKEEKRKRGKEEKWKRGKEENEIRRYPSLDYQTFTFLCGMHV